MNSNRVWAIGTVFAIAAVLGLGWLLGVSPLMKQSADAAAEAQNVEQSNNAQQAVLEQMKQQFSKLDELETQLAVQALSIPNEVDSDVMYSALSGMQAATGAPIDKIVTGEAKEYGLSADEVAAEASTDPSAAPAPTTVPGLYTVPITITFSPSATQDQVLQFAWRMQSGPRLFLVTGVARTSGQSVEGGSETSATITAYMFVMSNPDATPGSSAGTSSQLLAQQPDAPLKDWGWRKSASEGGTTAPSPNPTESASPDPSGSPTPTPTGSATPTP